jgi:hypothetical protein
VVISPAWATLTVALAEDSGETLQRDQALKIATGVALGVGSFVGGIRMANTYLVYTGVGTLPAALANASANALLTWLKPAP